MARKDTKAPKSTGATAATKGARKPPAAEGTDGAGKKQNPLKQMVTVYRTIKPVDPQIGLWMVGAAVVVLLLGTLIGSFFGPWWVGLLIALPFAVVAAIVVLGRRGEKAAYKQIEGQPGATAGAMGSLRGWYTDQEPVAAEAQRGGDLASTALVFRALGRPGVVLLAEGPRGRAEKLLAKEKRKVERVAPGVAVHTFHVGTGEDDLPVSKITRTLTRLKPVLSKDEMAVVNKRLRSIPGMRQNIPAGVDPTRARMDRRALRGR